MHGTDTAVSQLTASYVLNPAVDWQIAVPVITVSNSARNVLHKLPMISLLLSSLPLTHCWWWSCSKSPSTGRWSGLLPPWCSVYEWLYLPWCCLTRSLAVSLYFYFKSCLPRYVLAPVAIILLHSWSCLLGKFQVFFSSSSSLLIQLFFCLLFNKHQQSFISIW